MNKILPFLTVITLIVVIILIFITNSNPKRMIVVQDNNHTKEALEIKLNNYKDSQCGMTIETTKHSAQVVSPEGKTWFFDDTGCLALWYSNIKFKDDSIVWVFSNDTNKYINGKKAWYSKTDQTPMAHGFGAYKNEKMGMISFNEMIIKVNNNETLRNPIIKKQLGK